MNASATAGESPCQIGRPFLTEWSATMPRARGRACTRDASARVPPSPWQYAQWAEAGLSEDAGSRPASGGLVVNAPKQSQDAPAVSGRLRIRVESARIRAGISVRRSGLAVYWPQA